MKLLGWLNAANASKRFFTRFLMYSWHEVFLSLTVFAFEGKENALLFCHNRQLFFQTAIIFATNFCELVHRKTFVLPTDWFWKKRLQNWSWKKTKSLAAKKESYFRRLFGTRHGKQEISKVLYTFFVWSMKSLERIFQTIIFKWKQRSSSQKKY